VTTHRQGKGQRQLIDRAKLGEGEGSKLGEGEREQARLGGRD